MVAVFVGDEHALDVADRGQVDPVMLEREEPGVDDRGAAIVGDEKARVGQASDRCHGSEPSLALPSRISELVA